MSPKEPLPRTNMLKRLLCLSMSPPPADPGCFQISGKRLVVDLNRAPEIRPSGGALRIEDERLPDRVLLVHGIEGQFRAYRNRCACGGFRLDPVPREEKIRCTTPMQSAYDSAGRPLSRTVRRNLDVLPVETHEDRIEVDVGPLHETPAPHLRKDETQIQESG